MRRRIPLERVAAFDAIAEVSRTRRVLVVCESLAIRRQYIRAVEKRGGRLENLYFLGPEEES